MRGGLGLRCTSKRKANGVVEYKYDVFSMQIFSTFGWRRGKPTLNKKEHLQRIVVRKKKN